MPNKHLPCWIPAPAVVCQPQIQCIASSGHSSCRSTSPVEPRSGTPTGRIKHLLGGNLHDLHLNHKGYFNNWYVWITITQTCSISTAFLMSFLTDASEGLLTKCLNIRQAKSQWRPCWLRSIIKIKFFQDDFLFVHGLFSSSYLISADKLIGEGESRHESPLLQPENRSKRPREEDSLNSSKSHHSLSCKQRFTLVQPVINHIQWLLNAALTYHIVHFCFQSSWVPSRPSSLHKATSQWHWKETLYRKNILKGQSVKTETYTLHIKVHIKWAQSRRLFRTDALQPANHMPTDLRAVSTQLPSSAEVRTPAPLIIAHRTRQKTHLSLESLM